MVPTAGVPGRGSVDPIMPRNSITIETNSNNTDTSDDDSTDEPKGFSREPADYVPTEHFLTRFSPTHGSKAATRIAPEITGEVVETCIREGELLRGSGRCWRLETEVDGHRWRLVADIRPDELNRVLTALVPGIHRPGDHDPNRRVGGGRR